MPSCSVKWCSNHTSTCSLKSKNGVSFHRFPKDDATCKKWVEAVRYERRDPWWTSSNASRICSIHFKESDISSTPCKVNILAKTAVPVCTMVWYDDNENNVTLETSIKTIGSDKTILKTYERKKTNMNVLKESKVNMSYNRNKEDKMSKTNKTEEKSYWKLQIPNIISCPLFQDNDPEAAKLLKTLEGTKTVDLKEYLEPNNITNKNLTTNATVNITAVQKKSVLTEMNKHKCCKSEILVKLNDNTNFIIDEDLNNDGNTIFKEFNKVSKEPNTRIWENSKKVTLKDFESNENKKPREEENKTSNSDMFRETITNDNVEIIPNISKSLVGQILRTYLPKKKYKINEKNIREKCKIFNKNVKPITMKNGLNTGKFKENNHTNVNKYPTDVNNMIADLKSNKNSKEKTKQNKVCAFKNVKKYFFKRKSKLYNRTNIREQIKPILGIEPNIDLNTDSNITHIDEFITNHLRIDKIKETESAVYDEIISELFETSKTVGTVSDIANFHTNENMRTESNDMDSTLDKETNNMHVMSDLNTNMFTELKTLMDLELCSVVNSKLSNEINTTMNSDKPAINESSTQFKDITMSDKIQQLSGMNKNNNYMISESYHNLNTEMNRHIATQCNKNMCHNENITSDAIILSYNEMQNLEQSAVRKIVPETKKVEFTELKKHLSTKPKLDSRSELCANTQTDIETSLFSKYENIMSTASSKENTQVPEHNAMIDKNIAIVVNDLVTLQSNINNDATKKTELNVTNSNRFNSVLLEEFITNKSSPSNNNENMDSITNFNTVKHHEFEKKNISLINMESNKTPEKDMPDLNSFMNLVLCDGGDIEFNNVKTDLQINADFRKCNENNATDLNQQLPIMNNNIPMEHSDHIISESHDHLLTEVNTNITTPRNKNVFYNENISKMENLKTSFVNNIVNEPKKDEFTELKKHLSMKPKLVSSSELCTNTLTDTDMNLYSEYHSTMSTPIFKENIQVPGREDNAEFVKNLNIDVNNIVTSIQNNIYNDITRETESAVTSSKQCNSISNKELVRNISPESNKSEKVNATNNLKTKPNTMPTFNKNIISEINVCKKIEKDMPELNTAILLDLIEDQNLNSSEVNIRKYHNLNKEMLNENDLLLQKSDKDFTNVNISEDQHVVVNKHMDVVNNILNRDLAAEFDLSLLLSDTPIPDEEIQNVDNNSNYNSLDGFGGSPNWIQLPTVEMPKIIDDILDQDGPIFEDLDLFDKVNKFNIDKEADRKDNENKKPIKQEYSDSNFGQFEKQIINSIPETGKHCAKNTSTQIEEKLVAEFSDYNETSLEQNNNICNENKVIQTKKVRTEQCYDSCDGQIDKRKLQLFLQPNNKQSDKNGLNQIVDECNKHSEKEILDNKTINQCQKQDNVNSKTNQIEDPTIKQYFGQYLEQNDKTHGKHIAEQAELGIDKSNNEVLNDLEIFELSKKQYGKQSNEQTCQTSIDKLKTMEEAIPKSKIHNHTLDTSSFQAINQQLFKDFHEKVKEVSNEAQENMESERVPNIGKLKRVIFEECYDSECLNNCKNQKHKSNNGPFKTNVQRYKNQPNYTPYDLNYKRQCNQSSIDNFNEPNDGSFDQNIKQMSEKGLLERQKLSHNEEYQTKYKKIAIDHIPGQYLVLKWKESLGNSNSLRQEGKRKYKDLELGQKKELCSESSKMFTQQTMAECPECGYTTDDNDLMNYQSDVDLRITTPLSIINKDMLISLSGKESKNNENNNRVPLESVYAMELAYITAIQALERKLKQNIAISEYRLRKVNNLSKINNN